MAGHDTEVELMRKYSIPQTPEEVSRYSFMGYGIFGAFLVAVIALTLYFV